MKPWIILLTAFILWTSPLVASEPAYSTLPIDPCQAIKGFDKLSQCITIYFIFLRNQPRRSPCAMS